MNIIVLVLLVVGLTSVTVAWTKPNPTTHECPKCPDCNSSIVPLDVQFSEANRPSAIYNDMFNSSNVWMGGYNMDAGRTVVNSTSKPVPKTYGVV
ncbi:hypothetical protein EB118_17355 [bacterium]|nr:hypothetical protein [bacterium]NDD83518.1 hypothetical protein [bacterium]NDG31825.1 hypothetical protein [bacterium]